MPMIPVRIRNGAVTAVAVFSLACGGEEAPAPAVPSSPDAPAAQTTPPPPPPLPNNIQVDGRDADGNPVRFSGTDGAGRAFEAQFGEDANIPSGFPDDVPIFPSATPTAAMTSAGEGVMVTFKSDQNQQQIFQFYQSELTAKGWTIESKPSFGGQLGLEATKSSRKVVLQISGTKGDSHISLMVTDAG